MAKDTRKIFTTKPIPSLKQDRIGTKNISYTTGGQFTNSFEATNAYNFNVKNKGSVSTKTDIVCTPTRTELISKNSINFIPLEELVDNDEYLNITADRIFNLTYIYGNNSKEVLGVIYGLQIPSNRLNNNNAKWSHVFVDMVDSSGKFASGMLNTQVVGLSVKEVQFEERSATTVVKINNEDFVLTSCGVLFVDFDRSYKDPHDLPITAVIPNDQVIPDFNIGSNVNIVIRNDNVYHYNEYSYLHFTVPVPEAGLVGFVSTLFNHDNLQLTFMESNTGDEPEDNVETIKHVVGFNPPNGYLFNNRTTATFRARVPRGVTGTIKFGFEPSTNKYFNRFVIYPRYYNALNPFPGLEIQNQTISNVSYETYRNPILSDLIIPRKGVFVISDSTSDDDSTTPLNWETRFTKGASAYVTNNIQAIQIPSGVYTESRVNLPTKSSSKSILYRTESNSLIAINYEYQLRTPIKLKGTQVIVQDLTEIGIQPDDDMGIILYSSRRDNQTFGIEAFYDIELEQLTEFHNGITVNKTSHFLITDIYEEDTL